MNLDWCFCLLTFLHAVKLKIFWMPFTCVSSLMAIHRFFLCKLFAASLPFERSNLCKCERNTVFVGKYLMLYLIWNILIFNTIPLSSLHHHASFWVLGCFKRDNSKTVFPCGSSLTSRRWPFCALLRSKRILRPCRC